MKKNILKKIKSSYVPALSISMVSGVAIVGAASSLQGITSKDPIVVIAVIGSLIVAISFLLFSVVFIRGGSSSPLKPDIFTKTTMGSSQRPAVRSLAETATIRKINSRIEKIEADLFESKELVGSNRDAISEEIFEK